jgi:hypothetical protein
MTQQLNHQICITASRKTKSHCGTSWEHSCSRDPRFQKPMTKQRSRHWSKVWLPDQQLRIWRKRNLRQLKNFFMNWKSTSCLMMIIAKECPNEMKHDKATEKWLVEHNPRIHETSTMWKILSLNKTTGLEQEEDSHPEEGEEDPRDSRITTQKTRTSWYCQYHGRGHNTEGCPETKKNMARIQQEKALMNIVSSMPNQFRPNFWQPQFMNSQPSPVAMQQFQQPQSSWQPSQQFSLSCRQSNRFSNCNQFGKSCHHHPIVR